MAWNKGWDDIFQDYEWGRYPDTALVRFIARNFKNKEKRSHQKILEIGCGTGANLWFLAREGFIVYGIDGSNVAIEKAASRMKEESLTVDLKHGDIMQLPYDDGKFDGVIDIECLYSNSKKDSKIIIEEIKRVLKPGAFFFSITFMTGTYGDGKGTPLPDEPNTYIELNEGAFKKGYGIIRFTSEQDLKEIYSAIGVHQIDYYIRSEKNRSYEIKEWAITCRNRK